ncbi:Gfo/Idh/MocA family oxidoreductase [Streptomyces pactum]|uniref:Gfo/Idh/MocA family oxidoreductase n=1 Tax=Streptomyces pactum TaxID=68249 RepID=A0ABS0NL42_9ACTN|nr:Gfo/Idh/MocA family oxidoreductase [Streptomyces pactum]MBH5335905.1 Gfo/Idh/MocA family oxidoreductase [Streptomyces pactum]
MDKPLRVGIIGAGNISGEYMRTLTRVTGVRLVKIASRNTERARAAARGFPGVGVTTTEELYTSDEVDLILGLTTPEAHLEVARAAIAGGKHLYGEKPLATTAADARAILDAAARAGVRVGCAPDTVLGAGIQTARACLDGGAIGTPVAASAFMFTPGHERWHPDPEFYYRPGGGPLLDMGPYYLTALVSLLGPVRRVTGMSHTPRTTRTIASGPRAGTTFGVEVATHVTGVLQHDSGALSTLIMSFDVWESTLPRIEVYGSQGTLLVPDPNSFGGEVRLCRAGETRWRPVPVAGGYRDGGRGIGVADMAEAIARGTAHRADGELAHHVVDIMECLLAAAETGSARTVHSTCERPAPVALDARPGADRSAD